MPWVPYSGWREYVACHCRSGGGGLSCVGVSRVGPGCARDDSVRGLRRDSSTACPAEIVRHDFEEACRDAPLRMTGIARMAEALRGPSGEQGKRAQKARGDSMRRETERSFAPVVRSGMTG